MATAGIDLEQRILELSEVVVREYDHYKDVQRNLFSVRLDDDMHPRAADLHRRAVAAIEQRANDIEELARLAPQSAKACLFHAAVRLRTFDRDVPKMLADAVANIANVGGEGIAQQAQQEKIFPAGREGIKQDSIDIAIEIHDRYTEKSRPEIAREHFRDLPDCAKLASNALKDIRARESKGRIVLPDKRNKAQ